MTVSISMPGNVVLKTGILTALGWNVGEEFCCRRRAAEEVLYLRGLCASTIAIVYTSFAS